MENEVNCNCCRVVESLQVSLYWALLPLPSLYISLVLVQACPSSSSLPGAPCLHAFDTLFCPKKASFLAFAQLNCSIFWEDSDGSPPPRAAIQASVAALTSRNSKCDSTSFLWAARVRNYCSGLCPVSSGQSKMLQILLNFLHDRFL